MSDEDINRELSVKEMKEWLISLGISANALGNHVETLYYDHGFTDKASLIGISKNDLNEVNDSIRDEGAKLPVALRNRLVANLALKKQPLPVVATDLAAINEQIQAFNPALEFAKKEMEEATDHKPMSAASFGFAKLLLEGYQISVETDEPCMDPGPGDEANPTPYEWKVETKDGDTIKKGEHQWTPEAM
ncbi:hypothetical protein SEMRO_1544_G281260.1 [Seminavis robusta]|uniref:Uncharacterized protein n=1 Tax=Seminavis robusta TaxID=568900 RepID=A0A9N8ENR2_9STRA|nr:hypothetical protein SEMRO_1544_G281260.1 [Seminavis robusta]|eukprot:Sro1544_g281260.1 n/a (190) ;mRNA; r:22151-22847